MSKIIWTQRWSSLQQQPALVRDTRFALAAALDELDLDVSTKQPPADSAGLVVELETLVDRLGPFELSLLALVAVALSEAHELSRDPRPRCVEAQALVDRLAVHAAKLPRPLRALVDLVRDGIALDGGRRQFVEAVRRALRRADRWRPRLVEVDQRSRPRLGGLLLTYSHDEHLGDGTRAERHRRFTLRNVEGRLFLLVAAGMHVASPPRSALSRVRRAVDDLTKGAIQLTRRGNDLRFEPPLELTRRAALMARRVGSVRSKILVDRRRVPSASRGVDMARRRNATSDPTPRPPRLDSPTR